MRNPAFGMYRSKVRKIVFNTITYLFLSLLTVTVLYPIVWTFFGSLRNERLLATDPWGVPKELDFSVYADVWVKYGISTATLNSLIISSAGALFCLLLCLPASYAVSRMKWRLSKLVLSLFLAGLMIPVHATLIPLYIILHPLAMGFDERVALLIPYIVFSMPVAMFLLSGYITSIPISLEEAAILDGCSIPKSFIRIVIPTMQPAIATVLIFSFMGMWNELLFAMVFLRRQAVQTLPLGIMRFTGFYTTQWQPTFAAIMIAIIPSIVLYVFLQEKLIQGMTAGALKG